MDRWLIKLLGNSVNGISQRGVFRKVARSDAALASAMLDPKVQHTGHRINRSLIHANPCAPFAAENHFLFQVNKASPADGGNGVINCVFNFVSGRFHVNKKSSL